MTAPEDRPADPAASLIGQLRELIRLLESEPGLPVGESGSTDVRYHADSAEAVDEVADILGVTAGWNKGRTRYRAEYRIGPNVSYLALYITPEHMAAFHDHMAEFHHGEEPQS